MNSVSAFMAILCIDLTVAWFAPLAKFTVQGVPVFVDADMLGQPNIITFILWCWNVVQFLVNMALFQVDNVPTVISSVFLFMNLTAVYLLVRLVRGVQ